MRRRWKQGVGQATERWRMICVGAREDVVMRRRFCVGARMLCVGGGNREWARPGRAVGDVLRRRRVGRKSDGGEGGCSAA